MVLTAEERKERKAIHNKKYYDANKEKILEYHKQYSIHNKETIAEYKKQYKKDNHKTYKISRWKNQGIIVEDDDWNGLYEYFIKETNCWICNKVYNKDNRMDFRCLDHDHDLLDEPNIRYICCHYCNLHIVK
jgi:hypothetical protein